MKEFLPYDIVRNNALKLAYKMYKEDGFVPDVIYVPLRGGAYMGNVISEFYKMVLKGTDHKPVFYAAVVARSYTEVKSRGNVAVDGWTYSPENLRPGDKVLFVDDIYDSGYTINFLVNYIISKGLKREDIKVAVHDYKVQEYVDKDLNIIPDYWCRKHVIKNQCDEIWIHYLSHELVGLTDEELEQYYYSEDPELRKVFSVLKR